MARYKQTVVLEEAYVAISNALHRPDLQTPLSRYGYDQTRLQEGLAQYTTVKQLTQQREQATQTARETATLYQQSKEQLIELFQMHRDIARIAFRREAQYADHLKLTGPRETNLTDLLAQAKTFYAQVPAEMMELYRVPRKELNEVAKLVTKVRELQAMQRHTQSQVQSLTQTRTQALKELQTWMRRFMTVARVALEEKPQQLEALNQTVAS